MEKELIFNDNINGDNNAILGTLEGPCADFIDATRNGRVYDESVWEKVFGEDSIVNELIDNGGIPGEMDHPTDGRTEVDSSRIAILMREKPIKREGKLWARFDILNTPLGKIAYTLAKAGFKLGISSRGTGDTFQGPDGLEHVDEDSYDFRCFDLVLIPSVQSARLNLVTEGLSNKKKFNYKKALVESLSLANADERKIMVETLNNLNINLEGYKVVEKDKDGNVIDKYSCKNETEATNLKDKLDSVINKTKSEVFDNEEDDLDEDVEIDLAEIKDKAETKDTSKDTTTDTDNKDAQKNPSSNGDVNSIDATEDEKEVVDDKSELIEGLQNALMEQQRLAMENRELQEKLSVCYAKEANFEEAISSYKDAVRSLSSEAKQIEPLRQKVSSLTEQLDASKKSTNSLKKKVNKLESVVRALSDDSDSLNESLDNRNKTINKLKVNNNKLNEELNRKVETYEHNINLLNEQLADVKKDSEIHAQRFDEKLARANKMVESYRSTAQTAVNRYIGLQAKMLGINPNEIKHKLDEHYSFNDIDAVCEDLKRYKLNINSLPYNVSTGNTPSNLKMSIQESFNPTKSMENTDDSVDSMLLDLVKL